MRGIGVAVITSTSTASPFFGQRQALMHAEAMLLVDHRQREVAKLHILLEQRMGADEDVRIASGELLEDARRARGRARDR